MERSATSRLARSLELLERSSHLTFLGDLLATVQRTGEGRLVLVSGEAGVGKTTLLRRFCEEGLRSAPVLWGACDALFTPRPLGPLLDVAEITGGELAQLVESGVKPFAVVAALKRDLAKGGPAVVVLEDLQWGDEATLDVLKLLGRRVEAMPALVLVSYRDDELDHGHPLRGVLGELATGRAIERLHVDPLSAGGVATLAEPYGVDAGELYRKTDGNPFFVTEALAAGDDAIPRTVRDAVLARTERLSPAARTLLEAVAVVPPQAELWLLEALAGEAADELDECLACGMLVPRSGAVAFRHELARLAVDESLAPHRRIPLDRKALAALRDPPSGAPDLARLAHHAEAATDADAALEFAPAAAVRAASLGAHREAAAQYARAIRFADSASGARRAELLERYSYQCHLTNKFDEAIDALAQAIQLSRARGDRQRLGSALTSLGQVLGKTGRFEEAERSAREAVAVLEPLKPGRELARAYSRLSGLRMYAADPDGTVLWGTRALELAQDLGDTEIRVDALNCIGSLPGWSSAEFAHTQKLEQSLQLALQAGFDDAASRAFSNLAECAVCHRRYRLADSYMEAGLEYCTEHGIDLYTGFLLAIRAWSELDQGRWSEAVDCAQLVLTTDHDATLRTVLVLRVLGLVRARRGDPGAWEALDEALALSGSAGEELQRIAPVATARAEAAWLEGRHEAVAAETEAAFDLALRRGAPWVIGELACWRWRAGMQGDAPPAAAEPHALEISGDWKAAAEAWERIGCPYERALVLASGDDEDALRTALSELQQLGAKAAVAIVARRLRERGVRGVPRGPRPRTRENPAGLTARELEVVALVADGLRNAKIAERLTVSEKTVDHHVSAILRKLNVRTRGEATAAAARLGLLGPSQESSGDSRTTPALRVPTV